MTTTPVPAVALPLAPLLARCEERLRQAVSPGAAEVVDPALDTLTAGGKRVRPLLVFCSAPRAALADPAAAEDLLSAAVAIGGAFWAWLYERSGSLVGPWMSHLLVDAGIFLVGFDLVRGML